MNTYDEKTQKRLYAKLTPSSNGCMVYTGAGSDQTPRTRFKRYTAKGYATDRMALDPLRFHYHKRLISPKAVAYGLAKNIDPFMVRKPFNTCGNRLCCNADHLITTEGNPKFEMLETLGFSRDSDFGLDDLNQMSDLVFTDNDLETYLAVA